MKTPLLVSCWLALAASACFSLGCESTPWTIVRQATPDPFVSQRDWVVEPLRFDNLIIDGEPIYQYLAERDRARSMGDPRFQRDIRFDLAKMSDAFVGRTTQSPGPIHVAPATAPGAFTIRAWIHGISTGQPRGYPAMAGGSGAAEAFLTISLIDPEGRELDVVDVQTEIGPDAPPPTTDDQRLPECGARIGDLALNYLATRVDTLPR